MKKVFVFGLFILVFGLIKSPPIQAQASSAAGICKPLIVEPMNEEKWLKYNCCEDNNGYTSPEFDCCVAVGGGSGYKNTDKYKCCMNPASCKDPSADNCSNYITDSPPYLCCKAGFNEKTDPDKFKCCAEHVNKGENPGTPGNPAPCGNKCDKYKTKPEQRCCSNGYDPSVDKAKWDCCVANLSAKPAKPHNAPCGGDDNCPECPRCPDCPRCPEEGRCPECPKPTPLDCNIFKDPGTKACCEKFKFLPAMVVGKCLKPGTSGDCDIDVNIVAEAGSTVNVSNMNVCCQYLNNPGMMKDVTMQLACENITTPTPPPPGTPGATTPAGAPAAQMAAQCSCTPRETMVGGTAFAGTPWDCESSLSGALVVTVEDPFKVVDPVAGETKSATLPSNKFEVRGPVLTNWHDNPDNAGKVTACAGGICSDCLVATKAEIFGGSGGEGGCSLRRNP